MNILRQTSIFCPLSTPPSTQAKPHYLFANPSPPRASVHVVWVELQPWFREWHVPSEAEPISPHTSPVAELGLGVRGTCPIRISLETADCQTIREEDSAGIVQNRKDGGSTGGSGCRADRQKQGPGDIKWFLIKRFLKASSLKPVQGVLSVPCSWTNLHMWRLEDEQSF